MPQFSLSDGAIWYARRKARQSVLPPLVLLHGAGGSHLDWPGELRHLPGVETIVVDLPGHGKSSLPARQSIDAYAEDLVTFLQALQIPGVVLLGHSMGGAIALSMAIQAADRIKGLVLIGTGARLPVHPAILTQVTVDPAGVYSRLVRGMWVTGTSEDVLQAARQRLESCPPDVVHADFLACDSYDVRASLPVIDVPALVIGGTADRMTPLVLSETLVQELPDAELVVVEDGGHMMALEQPAVVAGAVLEWFQARFTGSS